MLVADGSTRGGEVRRDEGTAAILLQCRPAACPDDGQSACALLLLQQKHAHYSCCNRSSRNRSISSVRAAEGAAE